MRGRILSKMREKGELEGKKKVKRNLGFLIGSWSIFSEDQLLKLQKD